MNQNIKYLASLLLTLLFIQLAHSGETDRPKLILAITVDQLRGDTLWRFQQRFSNDGFRYLMEHGVSFKNAHYSHSNTVTAAGHATLFTGGNAAQHGMLANDWYDQSTNQPIYCVADKSHRIIGEKMSDGKGRSPRNLTASTIGDELIISSAQKSRVFAVSLKDRGAIIPAGHLGKAFWYSRRSGGFVSSTYYYDAYPGWASRWNNAKKADKYKNDKWRLLQEPNSYIFSQQDDRPWERSYKKLGRVFPHDLAGKISGDRYSTLRFTPMADELTLDFVKTLLREEKLGQGNYTDMLAVSFSATDYIGHLFGPNSLEAEDNLLRLDLTLGKLLRFIDDKVGFENTLIILSSDHGIDAIPEYRIELGQPAGRHISEKLIAKMNLFLKQRFAITEDLIVAYFQPSIYLDLEVVKKYGLVVEKIERTLATEIVNIPGIALALTRTDLLQGKILSNKLYKKVQNAFHPTRSGNVLIVQEQFWYLNDSIEPAAGHGSPYAYDTHVPIIFAGRGIEHKVVTRLVGPEYIAASIATYLNIPLPSGSSGKLLEEVLHH